MSKQQNLSELLERVRVAKKDYEAAIRESRDSVQGRIENEVCSPIYATQDGEFISRFENLVDELARRVEDGSLKHRVKGMIGYLQQGKKYRDKKLKDIEQTGEIRVGRDAAVYLQKRLADSGHKMPEAHCYRLITKEIKEGRLKPKVQGERSRIVKTKNLDRMAEEYSGVKISERKGESNFEIYRSLRNSGKTREEIAESGEIKVPRGKNVGKYYAAMESCFKQYR